jgi:hypothetical protein
VASTGAGGEGGDGGAPPSPLWGELPGPPELETHRSAACTQGERILVLTQEDDLLSFDPALDTFSAQTTSECGGGYSMAMTGAGELFTFSGAQVLTVDPSTGACSVLAGFAKAPGFDMFALGFVGVTSAPGGRLVAVAPASGTGEVSHIATIDPVTGAMQVVGPIHPNLPQIELASGRDDRITGLSGDWDGTLRIVELDVATGAPVWTIPVPGPMVGNSFATARWGDDVYTFFGSSDDHATQVHRTDLTTGLTTTVGTFDIGAVIGAGTPSCAVP